MTRTSATFNPTESPARGVARSFGWAGLAVLLLPALASCKHESSPEDFCRAWVEDTCQVRAGCCEVGFAFDLNECRLELSDTCQEVIDVEKIHSGEYVFDIDAARECLGKIETCGDLLTPQKHGFDHARACANVLTGFRPLGAACRSSNECAQAGAYTICYTGLLSGDTGICAEVAPANLNECSFSFDTYELRGCPDQMYCEIPAPGDAELPSERAFEFRALCKSFPGAGDWCVGGIPCADGLYCDFTTPDPICASQKTEGEPCEPAPNACTEGLSCTFTPDGGGTCNKATSILSYCVNPTRCGGGTCDLEETPATCPQDCGGDQCGDGLCGPGEHADCPQDCP